MTQATLTRDRSCPRCSSRDTERPPRTTLGLLAGLLGLRRYRCQFCRTHFWRFG